MFCLLLKIRIFIVLITLLATFVNLLFQRFQTRLQEFGVGELMSTLVTHIFCFHDMISYHTETIFDCM